MNKYFLPIKEKLAEILQRKRIQSGMSKEDLVEKMHSAGVKMSLKTYERIEDGNYYPTLETFLMLLKVLNCQLIIDGENLLKE